MPADLPVAAPDHAQILERARDYAEQVKGGVVLSTFNLALFINELADALDALLAERQQDKERIERLEKLLDEPLAPVADFPSKLEWLAYWLDGMDSMLETIGQEPLGHDVQDDLRRWAREWRAALAVEEDATP